MGHIIPLLQMEILQQMAIQYDPTCYGIMKLSSITGYKCFRNLPQQMLFLRSQRTLRLQHSFHCLHRLDGETGLQREDNSLCVTQQVCNRAEARKHGPLYSKPVSVIRSQLNNKGNFIQVHSICYSPMVCSQNRIIIICIHLADSISGRGMASA